MLGYLDIFVWAMIFGNFWAKLVNKHNLLSGFKKQYAPHRHIYSIHSHDVWGTCRPISQSHDLKAIPFFSKYLLSQWLNFKLFGITYLVGKIKFKLFFSGSIGWVRISWGGVGFLVGAIKVGVWGNYLGIIGTHSLRFEVRVGIRGIMARFTCAGVCTIWSNRFQGCYVGFVFCPWFAGSKTKQWKEHIF